MEWLSIALDHPEEIGLIVLGIWTIVSKILNATGLTKVADYIDDEDIKEALQKGLTVGQAVRKLKKKNSD